MTPGQAAAAGADLVRDLPQRQAGESGSLSTSGIPASPPSRSRTSSGTCPSSGTWVPPSWLSAAATEAPPPEPNTSVCSPQCAQTRYDMFSMTPATR